MSYYNLCYFQLGKWKHGQSQSVDVISSQHRGDTYKVIKDADSLDSGLQGPLIESELGSGSGQENHHSSVEKEKPSQKNGTTTTTSSHPEKSQSNFSKMTSRMKQASRENKIEEVEKPKASWSEHVWSKYLYFLFLFLYTTVRVRPLHTLRYLLKVWYLKLMA